MAFNFPEGFVWGTAAAAHQVEGNNTNCDFWMLEHAPDTIFAEPSGDACDHFHRYPEDIRLIAQLGFSAYRLSGHDFSNSPSVKCRFSRLPCPGGTSDHEIGRIGYLNDPLFAFAGRRSISRPGGEI